MTDVRRKSYKDEYFFLDTEHTKNTEILFLTQISVSSVFSVTKKYFVTLKKYFTFDGG